MTIRERWIELLNTVATGTRKTRNLLTPLGASIFGAFTAIFVLVAIVVDGELGLPILFPQWIALLCGIVVMAIGIGLTGWSAFHFLQVKGTPVPFNPPPTLVTSGPYRFVRNPMLTGVFLILFGIGFAINSLSLVVFFTPLYVLINVWELKQIEEPELIKRLGQDYLEYRKRTPMFFPGLKIKNK